MGFCQPREEQTPVNFSNMALAKVIITTSTIITSHHHHHDHPQTTSGEDVRDFTKLLRNKLMSRKSKKNSRLGYLPVQVQQQDDYVDDKDDVEDDGTGDYRTKKTLKKLKH